MEKEKSRARVLIVMVFRRKRCCCKALSKSEADPTRGVETLLAKAAGLNDISSVLGTTVGSEQSKEERELYIGNVPPNVTNAQFVDFLNRTIEYLH